MNRSDIESLLVWMLSGALLTTWLYGVYHAYTDHSLSRAGVALVLPPYGIYMAAEATLGAAHSPAAGKDDGPDRAASIRQKIEVCRADDQQFAGSKLDRQQFNVFCACFWQMVYEDIPPDEDIGPNGQASPRAQAKMQTAATSCMASVRYLGATGPDPDSGGASPVPE